jgi:t-SNARE complex subunit (syntaxin)
VIDREIDDLVAQVDAYVFKLYGLTSDEARTILKSLGKLQSYIEKIEKTLDIVQVSRDLVKL